MAITQYADLVDALQSYCVRSDTKFTNRIETFIGFAEDRIYNGAGDDERDPIYSPPVRSDEMKAEGTITLTDGVGTIPSDAIGIRLLKRENDAVGFDYMAPEPFAMREADTTGHMSAFYTIEGRTLKVIPACDEDITALYWKRLSALTSSQNTNALLVAHPRLYLAACLFEAFTWMQDEKLALGHLTRYRSIAAGLNKMLSGVRYGGGRRVVRPRVALP